MTMIRNEIERRNAEKQLEYLRAELEKREGAVSDAPARQVAEALRLKRADIVAELEEYAELKAGRVSAVEAESLDDLGELLIKARIIKDWSQADLARSLDMEPQQVQRYEKNDWQTASLWRLQEAAEALELDIEIWARVGDEGDGEEDARLPRVASITFHAGSRVPVGTRRRSGSFRPTAHPKTYTGDYGMVIDSPHPIMLDPQAMLAAYADYGSVPRDDVLQLADENMAMLAWGAGEVTAGRQTDVVRDREGLKQTFAASMKRAPERRLATNSG